MRRSIVHSPFITVAAGFALVNPSSTPAGVIRVPADFQSIQAAIQAAHEGDKITVAPGVYRECVDFLGKAVVLTSVDPRNIDVVYETVIEGAGGAPAVTFASGEGRGTVLRGFTIRGRPPSRSGVDRDLPQTAVPTTVARNRQGTRQTAPGGTAKLIQTADNRDSSTLAILIDGASPTIEYCRIIAGHVPMQNAVIRCIRGSALFDKCPIIVLQPEEPRRLVSSIEGTPEFRGCHVFKDGVDTWVYQIDGTPVAGTTTNADWRPDAVGGAHAQQRVVARSFRSSPPGFSPPPQRPTRRRGTLVEIWDAGLATKIGKVQAMLYRGYSLEDAIQTASRYVDFGDGGDNWPLIRGLDDSPLSPGRFGMGPPPHPIYELSGSEGEVPSPRGLWIQVHPFPARPMVPRAGGGWEGLSPPAAVPPSAPAKPPAP